VIRMGDCELLNGCIFFKDKMPIESNLGSLFKRRYCQGDNTRCARYTVATTLGRERIPLDLYPNMFDKAKILIEQR